jgi:hypothetical protein
MVLNFSLAFLMEYYTQMLWGMVRSLELVILQSLTVVPYPGHTFLFFSKCIEYANIDIFGGAGLY